MNNKKIGKRRYSAENYKKLQALQVKWQTGQITTNEFLRVKNLLEIKSR